LCARAPQDTGTADASNSLRNFGVVFESTRMTLGWGVFFIALSFLVAYGGAYSHVNVFVTQLNLGHVSEAVLVATFALLPLLYIAAFLSDPMFDAKEENKLEGTAEGSVINLNPDLESEVDTMAARGSRIWHLLLVLFTFMVFRIPYETMVSTYRGATTIALGSCALVMACLQSMPLAMINLQILFSTQELQYLLDPLPTQPAASDSVQQNQAYADAYNNQFEAYVLVASVLCVAEGRCGRTVGGRKRRSDGPLCRFAIISFGNTASNIFEHRPVTSWARKHHVDGEWGNHVGSQAAFWYHVLHFGGRAVTLVLGVVEFGGLDWCRQRTDGGGVRGFSLGPALVSVLFAALVFSRLVLWRLTKSERHWTVRWEARAPTD
jgi:hypothetical protein